MLGERSASPALAQALCLERRFSGFVSPAHTAHTAPAQPSRGRAGGCVGSAQVGQASTCLLYSFPPAISLSLSFPAHVIHAHQEYSRPPLQGAHQDVSCKISMSQRVAVQWVDVLVMTLCNPSSAGVSPGFRAVSGPSGAGIQSYH